MSRWVCHAKVTSCLVNSRLAYTLLWAFTSKEIRRRAAAQCPSHQLAESNLVWIHEAGHCKLINFHRGKKFLLLVPTPTVTTGFDNTMKLESWNNPMITFALRSRTKLSAFSILNSCRVGGSWSIIWWIHCQLHCRIWNLILLCTSVRGRCSKEEQAG